MDKEELQQNIALYYSKLPKDAQEFFSKMEWLDKLKKLSIKYALSEEQTQTLLTETTLIMLGIIPLIEYEETIIQETKLPREFAQQMIQEVKDYILRPVASQINEAYEKNSAPDKEAEMERIRIEEDLDAKFEKLPKHIQEAIQSSNYYDSLYELGLKYNLTVEQMGILEELTTGILTGDISSDRYERLLEEKVRMSGSDAAGIASKINEKILKPIRIKMMASTEKPKQSAPFAIKKSEEFILNKAGIDINPVNKPASLNTLELGSGKVETPISTKPAIGLAQKLQTTVQSPTLNTNHSPEKVSNSNTPGYNGKDPYRTELKE